MIHPGGLLRGPIEEPAMWCPGCKGTHVLPWKRGGWTFKGDTERPTFAPSFRITGVMDPDFQKCDASEKGKAFVCHFVLTDGILNFCADSTHELAGKSIPLPRIPDEVNESWDAVLEPGKDKNTF